MSRFDVCCHDVGGLDCIDGVIEVWALLGLCVC